MFYEPTVLVDVDHTMKAMTEETFGPTLPIMRVADAEEAIALANDSPYGLGAAVYTGERERGEQLARRLQSGAVCVNDALLNYFAVELPMGGWKTSGLGLAPRRGRHPQVHQAAVADHQPRAPEARAVHVPVQGEDVEAAVPRRAAALRPRQARLTPPPRPRPLERGAW